MPLAQLLQLLHGFLQARPLAGRHPFPPATPALQALHGFAAAADPPAAGAGPCWSMPIVSLTAHAHAAPCCPGVPLLRRSRAAWSRALRCRQRTCRWSKTSRVWRCSRGCRRGRPRRPRSAGCTLHARCTPTSTLRSTSAASAPSRTTRRPLGGATIPACAAPYPAQRPVVGCPPVVPDGCGATVGCSVRSRGLPHSGLPRAPLASAGVGRLEQRPRFGTLDLKIQGSLGGPCSAMCDPAVQGVGQGSGPQLGRAATGRPSCLASRWNSLFAAHPARIGDEAS